MVLGRKVVLQKLCNNILCFWRADTFYPKFASKTGLIAPYIG